MIWVLSAIFILQIYWNAPWKNHDYLRHDVQSYFSYLPALVVYQDLDYQFIHEVNAQDEHLHLYSLTTPDGRRYQKMPIGVALMNIPFYAVGHLIAVITPYPDHGYSEIEYILLCIAAWFYAFIALWYCRLLLRRWFTELQSAVCLLILFAGTNVFFYITVEPGMSHVYSLACIFFFLHHTIKWLENPKTGLSLKVGLVFGLMVLIRPTNVLYFVFPLVYSITSFDDLKNRFALFRSNPGQVAYCISSALLVIFIQLTVWYISAGKWVIFSYGHEAFYFNNPHLFEGLFSFRKGLLVYTPIWWLAILALTIMVVRFKTYGRFLLFSILFIPLFLYVTLSWWCWWYGGSFGNRGVIELFPILTIAVGCLLHFIDSLRKGLSLILLPVVAFCIYLNIVQTNQYKKGVLHYDSMTEDAWKLSFLKDHATTEFYDALQPPDYPAAEQGKEEYLDWKQLTPENQISELIDIPEGEIWSDSVVISGELISTIKMNIGKLILVYAPLPCENDSNYQKIKVPLHQFHGKRFETQLAIPPIPANGVLRTYLMYEGDYIARYRNLNMKQVGIRNSSGD